MNLHALRVFHSVAQHGKVTRAAEELHISQRRSFKSLCKGCGTKATHRYMHGGEQLDYAYCP